MLPVRSYRVCDPIVNDIYASDHNPLMSELILIPTYNSLAES